MANMAKVRVKCLGPIHPLYVAEKAYPLVVAEKRAMYGHPLVFPRKKSHLWSFSDRYRIRTSFMPTFTDYSHVLITER